MKRPLTGRGSGWITRFHREGKLVDPEVYGYKVVREDPMIDKTRIAGAIATVAPGEKLFEMSLRRARFGFKWEASFRSPWFEEYLRYMTRTLESKTHTRAIESAAMVKDGDRSKLGEQHEYYPMQKILANNRWHPDLEAKYEILEWIPGGKLNLAPFTRVGCGTGIVCEPMITINPATAKAWAQTFASVIRGLYDKVYAPGIALDVNVSMPAAPAQSARL